MARFLGGDSAPSAAAADAKFNKISFMVKTDTDSASVELIRTHKNLFKIPTFSVFSRFSIFFLPN
jgi:hypothetical protein